jgi:hypothetical protein
VKKRCGSKANKKKCPRLILSTGGGVKEKTDEKEGGNYCALSILQLFNL